ncbi:MAG: lipoprotein ABC transporter ATP-binding protein LolD [Treponema sp. CETP13]|nr:MAG: lipoprotein ABC transporter ATP-binding protein LolD [Treponema sp. CETP13]
MVHALAGVSTEIQDGEFTAIAGPSGSGKTTMLNLIGCLDSITSGNIFIDNENVAQMTDRNKNKLRKEKIGFIFQNYNLIPVLSAQENVELALNLLNKYSRMEIKKMASDILIEVGLDGMQHRKPNQLSGGQQQRVSIARALVKKPAVILADEPTANLDSKTSLKILDLMKTLNQKHGTTFIFSTHDQQVKDHCSRIIYLKDGQIQEEERK